jgi:signal transduction histidine kinase
MMELRNLPAEVAGILPAVAEEVTKLEKIVADFEAALRSRKTLFAYDDLTPWVKEAAALAEKGCAEKRAGPEHGTLWGAAAYNMEKNLLRIAVFHVLGNAVEASRGGDTITITTRREDQKAELLIADSGAGIDPA